MEFPQVKGGKLYSIMKTDGTFTNLKTQTSLIL